ncbi:MAG: TetR/AcrR family transcriptional regulator [Gemmatimonadetes bacterium]|nr:TetR/AcrR family transcriptional regulator [Gemmatimonadota bacterium]
MAQRDTRALIASAAKAEFAEFGYAGARVDRIARRAGVNKQLLFYYFGSKTGLYQAVMEGAAGEAVGQAAPETPPAHAAEHLRQAYADLFDSLGRNPDLARLIMLDALRATPISAASRRALTHFLEAMRRVIAEGQGHGYFRDEVDPGRGAQQAVVLALGYFALEKVLEEIPDPASARRWRDDTADLLQRAMSW